ncbi:MAG: efflux RND transporter permease subunit [Xenococcaceae cyanobacterium]
MWSLFYRNKQLLILTLTIIWVWGLSSFLILPRMEDPELTQRNAVITTLFPGASAERVESLVTEKIEEELVEIEEIKTLESTSQLGVSIIEIELEDTVTRTAVDEIWSRVRDRLNDAIPNLPAEAQDPEFRDVDIKAYTLITALTWDLESPPSYGILRRLAESLADNLRHLPGTEKVELFGDPEEEIVVEVNPADLAALGLTAGELSQQIFSSDAKVPAGQLRSTQNDLLIEVDTELDSLERIGRIPIQKSSDGQFTRLSDIAQVKRGIVDPPSEAALVKDRPAVAVATLMDSRERIDLWSEIAHRVLSEFEQQLPRGVSLQVVFEQNPYVDARLNSLIQNLLFGAVLVAGVTLFMMGWRASLVMVIALPLSVMMVFGGMRLLNIPLHQMSVTGLIVALGLLIDNAIIIVDEVQNNLKAGLRPSEAINTSVRLLGVPLLGSTLTTVLSFLPVALMPGGPGEFVGTIGVSVIMALISSLVLALTVIPALVGHISRPKRTLNPSAWWNQGVSQRQLTQAYRWTLDKIFTRPLLGILLALALPLSGFLVFLTLPVQFFPPSDRDQFYIDFELAPQASLVQTQRSVAQASEIIRRHPEVVDVNWFIGTSAPSFYYNLVKVREDAANYAQGLVQLNSMLKTSQAIQTLQTELDRAFPDAQVLVRQLEQGPPFDAPVELRLYGSDFEQLQLLGDQVRAELAKIPDVVHTRASLSEALPKLALQVDEEKTQLAGLSNATLAQQLNASLEGTTGGSILEATEELPVRVRLSNFERSSLDQITSLDLLPGAAAGSTPRNAVPISALANVELVPETATIKRRNQERINTIQAFITAGILPDRVLTAFKQRLGTIGFKVPPGYSFEFGGEAAERGAAIGNLLSTVGVLAVLMVATLVLSLGSFGLAGIIFVVAVASAGLAFGSLWVFNYPFGFTAIIGMVGLIGVAINDSIVVLTALCHNPLARQGKPKAVADVVVHSTRHVLTTTITTMAGFVPLLLGGGGFWPPLVIVIAAGLGGATLLALYFAPSAYLLLMHRDANTATASASPLL